MQRLIFDWYVFLSSFSGDVALRVTALDGRVGVPFVSALLLGVIGAAAPCQLSTSVGALAVLSRSTAAAPTWRRALAYLSGKTLVYTALGTVVILLGRGSAVGAIPLFQVTRKVLGPVMVVAGLVMVGIVRLPWVPGHRVAERLRLTARRKADGAPFVLGMAFGLSFCPTLFGLFFGFLIPLALSRPDGLAYPALFAVGTSLPLLAALVCVALGGESLRTYTRSIGRVQHVLALFAGVLFMVVGLHDTAVYWLL